MRGEENIIPDGAKVVFGLKAQGHIPKIEEIIKRWDESMKKSFPDEIHSSHMFSKHVWEEIGKEIGWEPFTAALYYFKYLDKK